jgi:hypothetical protein
LFVILPGSAILHAFLRFVALRGGISLQGEDFIDSMANSLLAIGREGKGKLKQGRPDGNAK